MAAIQSAFGSGSATYFAPTGLTGATAASRYVGATASGAPASGTFAVGDFVIDQTGVIWECTVAGSPGTWVKTGSSVAIDTTAAHIQPDGVQAAGAQGLAADSAHVHQENAYQSGLLMPSGALAETIPAYMATGSKVLATTNPMVAAIPLPKGIVVSNITYLTAGTTESGGSHAWVALADSTGKILAVSIDNTGATYFGSASVTTPLVSPYTVTTAGMYYTYVCVTATQPPNFACYTQGGAQYRIQLSPPLCGVYSAAQSAPPAVNTTLAVTAVTADWLYAYVS